MTIYLLGASSVAGDRYAYLNAKRDYGVLDPNHTLGPVRLPPEDNTPPSAHAQVLAELSAINATKRADYTGNEGPWANFERAADQLGTAPGQVVEMHIATKQARLRGLFTSGRKPNHESVRDTLVDRANYAVIAVALYDAGLYSQAKADSDGGQSGGDLGRVVPGSGCCERGGC